MKKNAKITLKTIADNYRKLISERLAHELVMIDEAEATANAAAAQHHRVLAQEYRSMLEGRPAVQTA
jgi:hypothetical protein